MAPTPALCRLPAPDAAPWQPISCSHPALSPQPSTAWLSEGVRPLIAWKAATQGMAQQPGQRELGSLPPCLLLARRAWRPSAKEQAAIKAQKKNGHGFED